VRLNAGLGSDLHFHLGRLPPAVQHLRTMRAIVLATSGELVDGGKPAKNRAVSLAVGSSELGACAALSPNMSIIRTVAMIVRLSMDTIFQA
jgi:hypothetical protein